MKATGGIRRQSSEHVPLNSGGPMIDSNMPMTVMSWPRIKAAGIAPVKKVHTCTTQFIIIRSPSRDAVPHLHV